ncbi:phage gp6-like head-tail connector protein [Cryptosporangium sp. NPDC051539]|uniref:phage gp6-like head-tail connector protein n=1 Tax=Cryptosporangium sp. NPDC051539 TaxID=3363962 RepID=UPI00379BAB29
MESYCTVDELRARLNDTRETLDADELQSKIDTASREIDLHCGRRFWLDSVATPRVYEGCSRQVLIDDVGDTTGLIVEGAADGVSYSAIAANAYELQPLNAAGDGLVPHAWWLLAESPYPASMWVWQSRIRVTARWGWSAVPTQVHEAALLRAAALFKRRESPTGFAGLGEFGVMRVRPGDVDVTVLLQKFVRPDGFA